MSIILQSSSGGSVTLSEPTTASNFTQTLPSASGTVMVSGNQPAFFVARGTTDQAISNVTDTVALFNSVQFDTASAYNTSTGRFTPQVAGYYQININISLSGNSITLASANIRKNTGIQVIVGTSAFAFNSTPYRMSGSVVIFLNGSTDFVDSTGYVAAASGQTINVGSAFSGVLVRAA
jgi:hypothetical protein